jgi:hypothetical protein
MNILICKFCKLEKHNKKSLSAHQSFCKHNPNRSNHNHSSAGKRGNIVSRISRKLNISNQKINYSNTLNYCCNCGNKLLFEKRFNKYCNHSCRASFTNKTRDRVYSEWGLYKLKFLRRRPDILKIRIQRKKCKNCAKYFWSNNCSKYCSVDCRKEMQSEIARNNPMMGGNKNTRAYGWYSSKYAGNVWLESSWEYKVAKSLDDNDIPWVRPKYFLYGQKKYFPDFYLTKYDVYLDPKNSYLQKIDSEKIRMVQEENKIKILILNRNQLTWDEISKMLFAL